MDSTALNSRLPVVGNIYLAPALESFKWEVFPAACLWMHALRRMIEELWRYRGMAQDTWNDDQGRWMVNSKAGDMYKAKYLLLNTGFAAKRYIPDWKGIDSFKGMSL